MLKKSVLILSFVSSLLQASDLQIELNKGNDLNLIGGQIYTVHDTLKLTRNGQKIRTQNATPGDIRTYAILKLAAGGVGTIIDAKGVGDVVIENLAIDGNRREMNTPDQKGLPAPFIALGETGGDNALVQHCLIYNARCNEGWGAVHVYENSKNTTITNNIIYGAGVDVLGNGRAQNEMPFGFADGVSISSFDSTVSNNLIIDTTDEGIMIHGARGCRVENNVIVAFSREILAGIGVFSTSKFSRIDDTNRYNYKGVVVNNNLLDSIGSRIHMNINVGWPTWKERDEIRIIVGPTITNNLLTGNAAGYGIVANGIEDSTITGNISTATYSGIADGIRNSPPDDPGPFLYDPDTVVNSNLQDNFKPKERHLVHVSRNGRKDYHPKNEWGYRVVEYGAEEAEAIVTTAFIEMLQRRPSAEELTGWAEKMTRDKLNADSLRIALMKYPEFVQTHGSVTPEGLQTHLSYTKLKKIVDVTTNLQREQGTWPKAIDVYAEVFKAYK